MSDFFREVDEEVRRDRILVFWQKYQSWVIGAVVLIIVGTAAVLRKRADRGCGSGGRSL
jgi:hypothetical protein